MPGVRCPKIEGDWWSYVVGTRGTFGRIRRLSDLDDCFHPRRYQSVLPGRHRRTIATDPAITNCRDFHDLAAYPRGQRGHLQSCSPCGSTHAQPTDATKVQAVEVVLKPFEPHRLQRSQASILLLQLRGQGLLHSRRPLAARALCARPFP